MSDYRNIVRDIRYAAREIRRASRRQDLIGLLVGTTVCIAGTYFSNKAAFGALAGSAIFYSSMCVVFSKRLNPRHHEQLQRRDQLWVLARFHEPLRREYREALFHLILASKQKRFRCYLTFLGLGASLLGEPILVELIGIYRTHPEVSVAIAACLIVIVATLVWVGDVTIEADSGLRSVARGFHEVFPHDLDAL